MMHSQANIFCVNRLRLALGHAAAISGLLLELLKHQNDDIKPYPYLLRGAIPKQVSAGCTVPGSKLDIYTSGRVSRDGNLNNLPSAGPDLTYVLMSMLPDTHTHDSKV